MKYEVIDNFLDKENFDNLVTLITDKGRTEGSVYAGEANMPWFFQPTFTVHDRNSLPNDKLFYMTHNFYDHNVPTSHFYDKLFPLLEKLEVRGLLRIKANLYPFTETFYEHPMHTDYPFSHSGALFSLNTCDGYTKLKDGTKIDSVANRMLLFDPGEEHCSTTTTNVSARININMNYLQERT